MVEQQFVRVSSIDDFVVRAIDSLIGVEPRWVPFDEFRNHLKEHAGADLLYKLPWRKISDKFEDELEKTFHNSALYRYNPSDDTVFLSDKPYWVHPIVRNHFYND